MSAGKSNHDIRGVRAFIEVNYCYNLNTFAKLPPSCQQNLNEVNARTQLLSPFYGQAAGHQGKTIECCFCNHNENRKFINNYRPLQGNCHLYYIGGTNAVEAGDQSNGKQKKNNYYIRKTIRFILQPKAKGYRTTTKNKFYAFICITCFFTGFI